MRSLTIDHRSWWFRAFCWVWDVHWSSLTTCHIIGGTLFLPLAFLIRPGERRRQAIWQVGILAVMAPFIISLIVLSIETALREPRGWFRTYQWFLAYQAAVPYCFALYFQFIYRRLNDPGGFSAWLCRRTPLQTCLTALLVVPLAIPGIIVLVLLIGLANLLVKLNTLCFGWIGKRLPKGRRVKERRADKTVVGVHNFFRILWQSLVAFKHYTCRKIEVV